MADPSTCAPLDVEVAAVLDAFPIDIGALLGGLSDETIGSARELMAQLPVPELGDAVERTDHEIPDTDGVVVRVHRPVGSHGPLPCLYWMHGGGLVLGSYEGDDPRFDRWCPMFDLVGVSVEYRLAPETPYPGPLEDCYVGWRGSTNTPPSSGSTATAPASAAPAPAATWQPAWPCSLAIEARSR